MPLKLFSTWSQILSERAVLFLWTCLFTRYSWNIETEILRRLKESLMKTQFHDNQNILFERFSPHCVLRKFRNLMCISNFPSVRQKQTSLCCSNLQIKKLLSWKFYNASFCWPVLWPFFLFPIPFPTKQIKKTTLYSWEIYSTYSTKSLRKVHNSAMSQNNSLNIGSGSLKKYSSFNKPFTLSVYRYKLYQKS